MTSLRAQPGHFLAVGCIVSTALWLLPGAVADESAADVLAAAACVDDDAKWAMYNSTCAEMKWLCNNEGYGLLVRKWCPLTCALCVPPPTLAEDSEDTGDDAVVLIAGRPVTVAASSLRAVSIEKSGKTILPPSSNASRNGTVTTTTTRKPPGGVLGRPKSTSPSPVRPRSAAPSPSNTSQNGTFFTTNGSKANLSLAAEPSLHVPTKWEITMPFKDALVHVLSKATLVPRAIWSSDQEHFVFEVNNGSLNTSDNVSSDAAERVREWTNQALEEEEDNRCPEGYAQVTGQVYGGDQFGRGYNLFATAIRECARWCTHTPGCGSFDYSPSTKRCFRNSQTRPTKLVDRAGYTFCRRAPCPSLVTEAACLGPGVAAGWHSAEVKLRPGSYCIWSAGKCSAPMACTAIDCFLPDGGLPGMELPPSKTLWISRAGLMATMGDVSKMTQVF